MKASKLTLENFRSAKNLSIDLNPKITLLVGVNGAGKTTIIDAMAILLSRAIVRLQGSNAGIRKIQETDICNRESSATLELTCQGNSTQEITWRLRQARKGRTVSLFSKMKAAALKELIGWASEIQSQIEQNDARINVPLFVYYSTGRSVLDIPLKIRTRHNFDLLAAYNGSLSSGTKFREFFEWYRNREDIENEHFRESKKTIEDPQLKAVRKAIEAFVPEFSNISVKRNPLRMEVTKDGKKLRVDQMSDGEKCLFAMVGDLARRLAIANPNRKDVLQGEGIVLIDEIDLHLHPAWQRRVITALTDTFPNCQFIVSTHSPQVYGEVQADCIRLLFVDPEYGLSATTPSQAFGLDSSEILEEAMGTKSRNEGVTAKLTSIFRLIDDEEFPEAKNKITELQEELKGSIPETVRAQSLIAMLEPDEGDQE
ncbi:TPA: ATPase [Candidatus Sumerlaeota bacterium]|jgi:predicted ATP-binding protein involved in virulence|nr:ATPase [Candidatus Sumerlaeota bacterium]